MAGERTESQGFYEMLWDCDHCETKGLFGKSQRHCPECGAPQNPAKRYFPAPDQQQRVHGHEYQGADRHCPACSAPMGAKVKNCTQCGSPMDGSKNVDGVNTPIAPPAKKRRIWPYIVVALLVVGFAIWWFFVRKVDAQVTVAAHRWERTIAIEEFGDHAQEAWRDQVPAGASLPVCHSKQRSTKQVQDGEDCHVERVDKKDGTFEQLNKCKPKYRSEPVTDDWCAFTVRGWKKVGEAKATGTGTTAAWPADAPAPDVAATLGAKRSGARSEKLVVDFGSRGSCDVAEATWRKLADGAKVKVEVRARSGDVVCSSL